MSLKIDRCIDRHRYEYMKRESGRIKEKKKMRTREKYKKRETTSVSHLEATQPLSEARLSLMRRREQLVVVMQVALLQAEGPGLALARVLT